MTSRRVSLRTGTTPSVGGSSGSLFRRSFESGFEWTLRGFLTLWLLAALGVVVAFVTPPRDHLRASDWQLDAGAASSFEIGQPKMIQSGPEPVWVIRADTNTFLALAAVCSRQHCVLRWNAELGVFNCPCHHCSYGLDGRSLAGQSRQPLRSFFVNEKEGRIRVHLRRTVRGTS